MSVKFGSEFHFEMEIDWTFQVDMCSFPLGKFQFMKHILNLLVIATFRSICKIVYLFVMEFCSGNLMGEIKDQKTNLKDCLDKDQKEHLDKNGRFCWFIERL
ncbi:hypothetical protein QL285_083039 [Trifolium repens]|nr:hypothetical protein QL285_083039 [Trifolium repens]